MVRNGQPVAELIGIRCFWVIIDDYYSLCEQHYFVENA